MDQDKLSRDPHTIVRDDDGNITMWFYDEPDGISLWTRERGLVGVIKWRSVIAAVRRYRAAVGRG